MPITALIKWVKKHFLTLLLLGIIGYLVLQQKNNLPTPLPAGVDQTASKMMAISGRGGVNDSSLLYAPEAAPAPDVTSRLVVQNSQMSLKVSDVNASIKKIVDKATSMGGYMVNSNVTRPEESVSGNVTVRVPAGKLDEMLAFCRGLAVKVVSENIMGHDVTDQYVDTQKRIDALEKTKTKFDDLLGKANQIQDILQIQQQIVSLQQQIDDLKGQTNYLEQTAKTSRVTVYLASDELELPYAPSQAWRPDVIFKTAVRALISFLRDLGTAVIWIGVFAVIWGPILILVLILKRRKVR
jgi:energy-converting hydrogenase Eha subunit F